MESITIGQIAGAITVLSIIIGFVVKIYKTYKHNIIDRFNSIEDRLDFVEKKRDEYEKEVDNSKDERMILMGGLLAALKGLHEMGVNDAVTRSIKEIENYMMHKTHK